MHSNPLRMAALFFIGGNGIYNWLTQQQLKVTLKHDLDTNKIDLMRWCSLRQLCRFLNHITSNKLSLWMLFTAKCIHEIFPRFSLNIMMPNWFRWNDIYAAVVWRTYYLHTFNQIQSHETSKWKLFEMREFHWNSILI